MTGEPYIPESTFWIATYAAFLSTLTFLWNLYKWLRRGPKLKGRATSNMVIAGDTDNNRYIKSTVYNRGSEATTVNNVGLEGFLNKKDRAKNRPSFSAIISHDNSSYSIPYRIEVGGEFSSMCIQNDDLIKKSNEMDLYFAIYHSFSDTPTLLRINPIKIK